MDTKSNKSDKEEKIKLIRKLNRTHDILSMIAVILVIITFVFLDKYDLKKCVDYVVVSTLFFILSVISLVLTIIEIKLKEKPIIGMYSGWVSSIIWTIFGFIAFFGYLIDTIEHCWK